MSMRKAPGLRLQTSIVQDNVPVQVFPGLFVGSIHAAFNVETLKSSKISHVLNLAGSYATFPEDFTYLSLSIRDKDLHRRGLKTGGVLIHCAGGRSRSPAVAMAFLMMKQQMSFSDVSAHVKTLRPVVSLNTGFEAQLKCLETAHGNVFVANQHLLKARLIA
ncbi:Protein-tyrosine phosphatase-like [Phytophthora cactorum]|nr:Protein-tyrosine phosphatase-like [Phytophthora cactorum]